MQNFSYVRKSNALVQYSGAILFQLYSSSNTLEQYQIANVIPAKLFKKFKQYSYRVFRLIGCRLANRITRL